ncbi:MAG TPA: DUF2752 domain-containing protein [Tepidisphaeraceae bacterium]|jgi:hypothetical protein|nr:DUF2752 domain-containing protein [Tepidisphaeraceae bacterium]
MSAARVAPIFSPRLEPAVVGKLGRLLAVAISLGCVALMVTAARVTPSPTGLGTHTQLGLEECQFLLRTGLPCPSCGMTTSYAWFARGNFLASFYIQPMGFLLALLTVTMFWTSLYVAATGRAVYRLLARGPSRYYVPGLLAWAIIAWAWKIFIHLHGIDGWSG